MPVLHHLHAYLLDEILGCWTGNGVKPAGHIRPFVVARAGVNPADQRWGFWLLLLLLLGFLLHEQV